ncbi:MAG: hypothetical protein ACP5QI_05775, partial [Candidatus Bathyarchaeia archaeon]
MAADRLRGNRLRLKAGRNLDGAMALRVLLDASILLSSLRLGMDPFREIEELILRRVDFMVTRSTVEELKKLRDRGKGSLRLSSLALELLEKKGCNVISDGDGLEWAPV